MLRKILLALTLTAISFGTWADEARANCGGVASYSYCYTPCYSYCYYPCPQYTVYCHVYWWNPCLCTWQTDYCYYTPWQAQWRVYQLQCCGYYAYSSCFCVPCYPYGH